FTEKKVFGSCQDCKTCPNICDTCQIKVNDRQEEVKQKFQTDPDYAVKITAEFVKVEVSKEYPLLIKET
ncbi:14755_t:CDS:1, partial [Racocetra persica]